jgi:hypothetical protein
MHLVIKLIEKGPCTTFFCQRLKNSWISFEKQEIMNAWILKINNLRLDRKKFTRRIPIFYLEKKEEDILILEKGKKNCIRGPDDWPLTNPTRLN